MSAMERIRSDRTDARRARDGERVTALGGVLAALEDAAKAAGGTLDEQGEIAVLRRERKRRGEAAGSLEGRGAILTDQPGDSRVVDPAAERQRALADAACVHLLREPLAELRSMDRGFKHHGRDDPMDIRSVGGWALARTHPMWRPIYEPNLASSLAVLLRGNGLSTLM